MSLADKTCAACEGGIPPLTRAQFELFLKEINPEWEVVDNKKLRREVKFPTFVAAIDFVNKVAKLAEAEGHHPDIQIHYNVLTFELWTHKIDGLFDNDFILAAKIDELLKTQS